MYWSTKFCLWNIVSFKHLRDLIKSTNFPPLIKQKSLHVFSVQISEVRQFSLVHWALACVVAGQGAAQQISIHLSFLIFAVSAECCLSWPMTVKEMFRPLWVTLSSVVNEQSEKSLRIILTFATKKKKKTNQQLVTLIWGIVGVECEMLFIIICQHVPQRRTWVKHFLSFGDAVRECLHQRSCPTCWKQNVKTAGLLTQQLWITLSEITGNYV